MTSPVPFHYLMHLLTVPVLADDIETRFVFDTGIGVTLISESLAARVGCSPSGSTYTGRRMSGHPVTIPMGSLDLLQLGSSRGEHAHVGILDMAAMVGLEDVEGFISLSQFRSTPVTVDYRAGTIVVEDQNSLADRAGRGTSVTIDVHHDGGYSTDVYVGLDLPGGRTITAEVDTGSNTLILDETLAEDVGIDLHAPTTRTTAGNDETGHTFNRYFATLPGEISLATAPACRQTSPGVMFQKIIHEGLIGDDFLRNFITTYDLANSRMIFAVPG